MSVLAALGLATPSSGNQAYSIPDNTGALSVVLPPVQTELSPLISIGLSVTTLMVTEPVAVHSPFVTVSV